MSEVEADGPHGGEAQFALPLDGEGAVERPARPCGKAPLLRGECRGHEVLEEALQIGKHRIDVGSAIARVVLVHKGIITGETGCRRAQRCFLADERHHALQCRQKAVPIALGAQVAPELFGPHGGCGAALDELGGQASGIDIAALELVHSDRLVRRQLLLAGRLDPIGNVRRGGLGVIHAGQVCHGLGPLFAPSDGHMGRFVGAKDGKGVFERFELAAEIIEFLERHVGLRIRVPDLFHSPPG